MATIHLGEALECLRSMPDNSVDSIVTDPPYGLSDHKPRHINEALEQWIAGNTEYTPRVKAGLLGQSWDSFVPPPAVWKECLRVLKPGGHLVSFSGARTQDLMGISIRLAGFEVRDNMAWIYGSGFPKSQDISKTIDKQRHDREDVLKVTAWIREARDRAGITNKDIDAAFGTTGMAGHWTTQASQPHVPTLENVPKILELVGVKEEDIPEDIRRLLFELNGRKGTPGESWLSREVTGTYEQAAAANSWRANYNGSQLREGVERRDNAYSPEAKKWQGWGTQMKPAHEPLIVARKPLSEQSITRNVLEWGTGALNIDASRVPTDEVRVQGAQKTTGATSFGGTRAGGKVYEAGRWPANVLLDESAAEAMDEQSGVTRSRAGGKSGSTAVMGGIAGTNNKEEIDRGGYEDRGGASRFFHVFHYSPKASTEERPVVVREDGTEVKHPTVKPVRLMRHLVSLVTPPGGVVLDPFAGSGSTLQAAVEGGFQAIGIEREEEYVQLIRKRLEEVEGVKVL